MNMLWVIMFMVYKHMRFPRLPGGKYLSFRKLHGNDREAIGKLSIMHFQVFGSARDLNGIFPEVMLWYRHIDFSCTIMSGQIFIFYIFIFIFTPFSYFYIFTFSHFHNTRFSYFKIFTLSYFYSFRCLKFSFHSVYKRPTGYL